MVNTSQQVGGSVGTALLSTIFAGAVTGYASAHIAAAGLAGAAAIHGYSVAFDWAAAIFGLGLLVATVVLPSDGAARARTAQAEASTDRGLGRSRRTRADAAPAGTPGSRTGGATGSPATRVEPLRRWSVAELIARAF